MPRKKVKNPRVPRTRAGNSWTEAQYWGFLRGIFRAGFKRYPVKYQVKAANKSKGKTGRGYTYLCDSCGGWFKSSEVEVDHIIPAGQLKSYSDIPAFVERMFCEPDGLQLLCKDCHRIKTNRENAERRAKEK